MSFTIPQSTAYVVMFKAYLSSDHTTEATGKTIVMTIAKNGGAFATLNVGGTVNATEISNGWYKVSLDTTDTGTVGQLAIRGAVATIDDVGLLYDVRAAYATAAAVATLQTDTDDIQTRLPAALVGGRMDSSVGAMATGVITAASIAADAITDAKVASDVTIASVTGSVGSVTGAVGSVTGNVGGNVTGSVGSIATGGITSSSFAAGAINAAAIAADAITDAKVASDVTIASVTGSVGSVTGAVGSVTGAVGSVTGNVGGNLVGTIGGMTAAALGDFFDTNSGTTYASAVAGSVVKEIASNAGGGTPPTVGAIADAVWDEVLSGHLTAGTAGAALNGAGSAGDPWTTTLPGAYGAGTAGKIVGDNLNATVSSRATQTSVDTIDDFLDTEIAAIKAKTDALPTDPADASDIAASFTTVNTKLDTIDDFVDTEIANIQSRLPAALVGGRMDSSVGAMAAGVITATSIAADAITDAKVAADVTIASVTGAVGSVTGNVGGNVTGSVGSVAANGISAVSLSTDAGAEIADAILDRDMSTGTDSGSPTVRTTRQALRVLRNKWSITAGVLTVTKENDATASWTAAVTGTAGADPITTVDPA